MNKTNIKKMMKNSLSDQKGIPFDSTNVRVMMEKRKQPKNVIDKFLKQAEALNRENLYNFKYEYFVKTLHGYKEDTETNHKYGTTRAGYEQWCKDNRSLIASYSGVTSVRTITDRSNDDNKEVGCIFETKLKDYTWQKDIAKLVDECFVALCEVLEVKDVDNFKYFIYKDVPQYNDMDAVYISKLEIMVDVFEQYGYDEDYKNFIDKIKG